MSLILEALRKSEAERQLGRAPGLLTPVSMRQSRAPGRRWVWIVATACVLLSALAAAWWLGRSGVTELPPVASESPSAVPAKLPATTIEEPIPPPVEATRAAPTVVRDPVPTASPADLPSDPEFESTERESVALPSVPAALPNSQQPQTVPSVPAAVEPQPDEAIVGAPAEAAPAPPPSSPEDGPPATPLRMLSAAERADLPPLRLSMHVFTDEPMRRFVMIDGRRLTEGEQVASNVTLTEIRRDGAVLEIRGNRVLIERP